MCRQWRPAIFALALLGFCGQSRADIFGGGVITLPEWNTAATEAIGQPVTVWRVYIAFDGRHPDSFDRMFGVNGAVIDAGVSLYQDPFGNVDGLHPLAQGLSLIPSLQWDSFVCVNTLSSLDGASVTPTPDGINFSNTGVTGGWFLSPDDDQSDATFDNVTRTALHLSLIGQITLLQAPPDGPVIDVRGGELGNGGVFSGWIDTVHNRGDRAVSMRFEFATESPQPSGSSDLLVPLDNAVVAPGVISRPPLRFIFSQAENAVSYMVEIAENGDFENQLVFQGGRAQYANSTSGDLTFIRVESELLVPGRQYAWRVCVYAPGREAQPPPTATEFTVTLRADIDRNLVVDGVDLARLLAAWGPCEAPPVNADTFGWCLEDVTGIFTDVDANDLAALLDAWGPVAR